MHKYFKNVPPTRRPFPAQSRIRTFVRNNTLEMPQILKLTPGLSEFEILNNETLIFQNRPVSRLFTNIFHNLNFAEEHK